MLRNTRLQRNGHKSIKMDGNAAFGSVYISEGF